jgi:hypothetical protein
MQRKLMWMMLLGAAIMVTAPYARPVLATPATGGFVGTTPVCPNAVRRPSSDSRRQPISQYKTGLKSSISGQFCDFRRP